MKQCGDCLSFKYHMTLAEWLGGWMISNTGKVVYVLLYKKCLTFTHVCIHNIIFASEFLYYSLPVIHAFLPEPFFTPYTLLVATLHILLSTSISHPDLRRATRYLIFNFSFEPQYLNLPKCTTVSDRNSTIK